MYFYKYLRSANFWSKSGHRYDHMDFRILRPRNLKSAGQKNLLQIIYRGNLKKILRKSFKSRKNVYSFKTLNKNPAMFIRNLVLYFSKIKFQYWKLQKQQRKLISR